MDNRKGRLVRDDVDDDISDDEERVDMSAITGVKELEERREKFYSVQQDGKCRVEAIVGGAHRCNLLFISQTLIKIPIPTCTNGKTNRFAKA